MTPTVHVLLHGRVLCGQIHGVPKDWGPQHRWVGPADWRKATCSGCREQSELYAEEGRRALEQSWALMPRHEVILPPPGVDDGEVE